MRRMFMFVFVAAVATAVMSGCELQETTLADAQDVVVAEIVLRAGDSLQIGYLHRTQTAGNNSLVTGANIVVRNAATGAEMTMRETPDSVCLRPDGPGDLAGTGTCYTARVPASTISAGARYSLRIDLPDHRVLTGVTDVPGAFLVTHPAMPATATRTTCQLEPFTSFELTWTRSEGASVYLTDTRFSNLAATLRLVGLDITKQDPILLSGLSVSGADTTLAFPGDLGVFDRFNTEVFDILLAIQNGLPPNTDATTVVAAADRNYVNWVRGGNFNPSGTVHISSIRGDGTGVFGSIVPRVVLISTRPSARQPCS